MRKAITIILYIWALGAALAAPKYPVAAIPDSLKKEASAIMRNYSAHFIQTDLNNATYQCTYTVTVLNENGDRHARFHTNQDRFSTLKSFSAVVENATTGKVIKKIGKGDLLTSSYSETFMSDCLYYILSYVPSVYPYTITIEFEERYQNGVAFYPHFAPIYGMGISIERASHQVTAPLDIELRYRTGGNVKQPKIEKKGNQHIYSWEIANRIAFKDEPYAPELRENMPYVMICPSKFCMEGECGELTSWEKFGDWVYQINKGRDGLPEEYKTKLREMVKGAKSEREKIAILFKHLQSTTRYVSIQLGIGGFQTIPAETVHKTGFGDCKALSNYMKAMLAAVDIPSNYLIISTKYKDLYPDFPSFSQMNHAILGIPLAQDTVWLECTSQTLPFDYAHSSIAGNQVLWTSEHKNQLVRVRSMPTDQFTQETNLTVNIDEQGGAKLQLNTQYRFDEFERMFFSFKTLPPEEQRNFLLKEHTFSKSKIEHMEVKVIENRFPSLAVNYTLSAENLANKSGNRLFIPLNFFQYKKKDQLNSENRLHDLVINHDESTKETYSIALPQGWTIETLPKKIENKTEFGYFLYTVDKNENSVTITKEYRLHRNRFPANQTKAFSEFLQTVDKADRNRIVLIKQP